MLCLLRLVCLVLTLCYYAPFSSVRSGWTDSAEYCQQLTSFELAIYKEGLLNCSVLYYILYVV